MKEALDGLVKDVVISKRLTDSPVLLARRLNLFEMEKVLGNSKKIPKSKPIESLKSTLTTNCSKQSKKFTNQTKKKSKTMPCCFTISHC